jgi:hypothetical protein
LQPSGQQFELRVCAEFVQAVNADLNRLGVVDGNTVDAFGVTHDRLRPLRCQLKTDGPGGERSPSGVPEATSNPDAGIQFASQSVRMTKVKTKDCSAEDDELSENKLRSLGRADFDYCSPRACPNVNEVLSADRALARWRGGVLLRRGGQIAVSHDDPPSESS